MHYKSGVVLSGWLKFLLFHDWGEGGGREREREVVKSKSL